MCSISSAILVAGLVSCGATTGPQEVCSGYPDWKTSPYLLPYPVGSTYRVIQGNCSGFGHSGGYKYSIDFAMPLGSMVAAARAGTVVEIRTGNLDGDIVPGHENFVKVLHSDGVISAYSHLGTDGVLVTVGQQVEAGDTIGWSGNTGATGGVPHLHFHLAPCSEPVDCGTLPVTFRNTSPNPKGLVVEHEYRADPP